MNISATTYRMLLAVRTLYTRPCRLLNCPRGQFNGLQGNIPTTPLANVPWAAELQHVVVLLAGHKQG
uniref:Small heat-shock protein n=1 Tax=Solanum tuberosum TaxID=4113 RepID=M1BP04_SOLTU